VTFISDHDALAASDHPTQDVSSWLVRYGHAGAIQFQLARDIIQRSTIDGYDEACLTVLRVATQLHPVASPGQLETVFEKDDVYTNL